MRFRFSLTVLWTSRSVPWSIILFPRGGSSRRKRRRGGGEERTMIRLTKKKIGFQSILKNEWSKTDSISKFFGGFSIHFGGD
jgi:hypothetical protein